MRCTSNVFSAAVPMGCIAGAGLTNKAKQQTTVP
jgi:hypothetical protein